MSPTFHYKAQASDSSVYEDTATAPDRRSLQRQLKANGERLIHAEETGSGTSWWRAFVHKLKTLTTVGTHEKITFARNLGQMLDAGLSLSRALYVLRRQTSNARLREVIGEVENDVGSGHQLFEALEKHPKIFSQLFTSMVKAGEESGTLSESLATVAEQMDRAYQITKKVRGAMIYPIVIIVIMIGIGVLAMLFIVPTLQDTFKGLGVELPMSTRILIGTSDFLRTYWIMNTVGLLAAIGGLVMFFRTSTGKRTFDWIILHTPIIAGMVKEVNAARTAQTLASLLSAGVEYVEALDITKDVVQNSYYKDILQEAANRVEKGDSLSSVIQQYDDLYPVFVGEMASVGEETGQIAEMLANTAEYYEDEVAQKTKNMSTIIEPVLMVIMGIGVGLFAISMLQPMYSLVGAI